GIRDRNVTGVQTCALPIFSCCLFLKIIRLRFCYRRVGAFCLVCGQYCLQFYYSRSWEFLVVFLRENAPAMVVGAHCVIGRNSNRDRKSVVEGEGIEVRYGE